MWRVEPPPTQTRSRPSSVRSMRTASTRARPNGATAPGSKPGRLANAGRRRDARRASAGGGRHLRAHPRAGRRAPSPGPPGRRIRRRATSRCCASRSRPLVRRARPSASPSRTPPPAPLRGSRGDTRTPAPTACGVSSLIPEVCRIAPRERGLEMRIHGPFNRLPARGVGRLGRNRPVRRPRVRLPVPGRERRRIVGVERDHVAALAAARASARSTAA